MNDTRSTPNPNPDLTADEILPTTPSADLAAPALPRRTRGGRIRGTGRDRPHTAPRRRKAILLRYTDDEYSDVAAAARLAGLTITGFVADTALAAARRLDGPSTAPVRAALVEVLQARTQVRRFAVNVNQAITTLHATGDTPPWLRDTIRITTAAVQRLDETAQHLVTATRQTTRQKPPASRRRNGGSS